MKAAMQEIADMAMSMLKLERDPDYPRAGAHATAVQSVSACHTKGELHAKRCAYIDALCIMAKHNGVSESDALDMLDMFADEPDIDEEAECPACPACNGPGVALGYLGKLMHFSCRDCGIDFNQEIAA